MATFGFSWDGFPETQLRALCRDLDLPTEEPAAALRAAYGVAPELGFIELAWPALLERMIGRNRFLRRSIIEQLQAAGVGRTAEATGRDQEMSFLRARKRTARLHQIALAAFLAAGEVLYGGGLDHMLSESSTALVDVEPSAGPQRQRSKRVPAKSVGRPTRQGADSPEDGRVGDQANLLGQFRLPGYGGAALYLRSHPSTAAGYSELSFDLALLQPTRLVQYRGRTCTTDFAHRLSEYMFSGAADVHPELSVETLSVPALGLAISYVGSTNVTVEIDVSVIDDLDEDDAGFDGLNFRTTRAVLAAAGHSALSLTGSSAGAIVDREL